MREVKLSLSILLILTVSGCTAITGVAELGVAGAVLTSMLLLLVAVICGGVAVVIVVSAVDEQPNLSLVISVYNCRWKMYKVVI